MLGRLSTPVEKFIIIIEFYYFKQNLLVKTKLRKIK